MNNVVDASSNLIQSATDDASLRRLLPVVLSAKLSLVFWIYSESESESFFIWSLDLGAPTKTIAGRCREGHHKYRHNTIMLGDEYNR